MRIVVHGQQAFGKSVLEALLNRGENVVGVFCAPAAPAGAWILYRRPPRLTTCRCTNPSRTAGRRYGTPLRRWKATCA